MRLSTLFSRRRLFTLPGSCPAVYTVARMSFRYRGALALAFSFAACKSASPGTGPVQLSIDAKSDSSASSAHIVKRFQDATQLSVGLDHGCVRRSDSTAWCWGRNDKGKLGDGTTTHREGFVRVRDLDNVEEVAAGFYASCARLKDGTVRCWGGNEYGVLGDGTTNAHSRPVAVVGVERARGVALGTEYGCALIDDGTVRCWGQKPNVVPWQDQEFRTPRTARQVTRLTDAVRIASAFDHVCAVRNDGTVWCWGSNFYGQLGWGTVERRRSCSIGPLEDWVSPPEASEPQLVPNLSNVVDIALSSHRTCALRRDHSLWCSTDPRYGGRLTPALELQGATQISLFWPSERGNVCGVMEEARLRCMGTNDRGQLGDETLLPPLQLGSTWAHVSNVAEVRTGRSSTCVRTTHGGIYCWAVEDTPVYAQQVKAATIRRIDFEAE